MSPTPELAIRLARAAFNRAIAEADLAAIRPLLAHNAVLVAGTDSALISGRTAQLAVWKREFVTSNRMIYTRSPETVIVSPAHPIALEHGSWRAASPAEDLVSGTYTAKWRRIGIDWVIEAEIYLTLT